MSRIRNRVAALPRPVILGLESSCDETAAAVVADGTLVLSNVIATQHKLHEEYAGVVPEIASRAHLERIVPVVREALSDAGVTLDDVDAIAVGHRPGLIGSLLVGVSAAKALAWSRGLPIVGVDHVAAHLHAPLLVEARAAGAQVPPPSEGGGQGVGGTHAAGSVRESDLYPALGLVVSGGHTSLYLVDGSTAMTRIGRTIDDAVGEAFDKAATMLGLGYPGGPAIDLWARRGNPRAYDLPVSMLAPRSLDFSFSGLKTALLYLVHGMPERGASVEFAHAPELTEQQRADFAASFEHAAITAVMCKLERALEQHEVKAVLVGGGVSANTLLRERLRELEKVHGVPVLLSAMEYCLDNAAMIAGAAAARYRAGSFDDMTLSAKTSSVVG